MTIYRHSSNGSQESPQSSMTEQKILQNESQNAGASLCIETVSGRLVDPSNPKSNCIDVHDIAWALSRIPRFAGHTITAIPFNVAQHSIYVSDLLRKFLLEDQTMEGMIGIGALCVAQEHAARILQEGKAADVLIKALFHDAHEAYLGDIPSPIKRIPKMQETFKELESNLDSAIYEMLGLTKNCESTNILIKFGDKLAQAIESYQFMPSRGLNWNLPKPTLTLIQQFPQPLDPLSSYKAFLEQFDYLRGQ